MATPHLVITSHGIRTSGTWQERLARLIKRGSPKTEVRNFKFGYFSMPAFWFPPTRWLMARRFQRDMLSLVKELDPERIDIVAHSFGTHIVAMALRRLPHESKLKIHTLIFAGSVLRSDFNWRQLIPSRVQRLINDCGSKDTALIASQFLVPLTGMAGRRGFVGMTGPDFANRYSVFDHGDYFERGGKDNDEYMQNNWLPLITGSDPVQSFDHRPPLTAARGLTTWFLNNLEPIKMGLFLTPLTLMLAGVTALYLEEKAARQRIQAAIALGDMMRSSNKLEPPAVEILDTMKYALNVPLQKTYGIWVDDANNNAFERTKMGEFGICFTRVRTGAEALDLLRNWSKYYSVVVSDFGRENDPLNRYGLIRAVRAEKPNMPYIFYSLRFSKEQAKEAVQSEGARAEVDTPLPLLRELFKAVNPSGRSISSVRVVYEHVAGCN